MSNTLALATLIYALASVAAARSSVVGKAQRSAGCTAPLVVEEDIRIMNRRYGYSAYAALGALTGGVLAYGSQLGPVSIAIGAVVGALFGAALRDAL